MAKKSKTKRTSHARRAAARPRPARMPAYRNAAQPAPSTPRKKKAGPDNPITEILYNLGSSAGTALSVGFLRTKGYEPKSIAATLAAGGVAAAFWAKDNPHVRRISTGVASAAGSQLAMMIVDDHDQQKTDADAQKQPDANADAAKTAANTPPPAQPAAPAQVRPANARQALPPGALDAALARAQARLALADY